MMRESGNAMVSRRHASSAEQQGARVHHLPPLSPRDMLYSAIYHIPCAESIDPAISWHRIHSVHFYRLSLSNRDKEIESLAHSVENQCTRNFSQKSVSNFLYHWDRCLNNFTCKILKFLKTRENKKGYEVIFSNEFFQETFNISSDKSNCIWKESRSC